MLHNANIYIFIYIYIYSNSKGGNALFFLYMLKVVRKCSILLKKQNHKKRNVIFYKDNN